MRNTHTPCLTTRTIVLVALQSPASRPPSRESIDSGTASYDATCASPHESVRAYELEAENERLRDELREASAQLEVRALTPSPSNRVEG